MVDDFETLPPIDLGDEGRLISSSRSKYLSAHPDNIVEFDSGIYVKSKGHIWSGDLDVTRDAPRLQEIATMLGEDLYILRERDYKPEQKLADVPWDNAIAIVTGDAVSFPG